ncbi:protein kinase, partial [bacterium]|nr:protein kinase [bacterium]
HKKGIVHRDLSPDNLMVAGYDEHSIRVKVIDFGIARQDVFDSESRQIMKTGTTSTGNFIGKLRYCSPEQAMELPIDHRSDQYSLALIFLETVTGRPAFEGNSLITMLMRRVKEPPPRLTDLVPGSSWPTEVDRVLERAMQSNPTERFLTILDFAEALGKALEIDDEDAPVCVKSNDLIPEVEADDLILGMANLIEPVDEKPDRTIYPGKDALAVTPQYGRVQAPPPKKTFPWFRISLLLFCSGLIGAYFLLPQEKIIQIKKPVVKFVDDSVATMKEWMAPDPVPTVTPTTILKKKTFTSTKLGNEPLWMGRKGIVLPVILKSFQVEIPEHLKTKYSSPMKIVVQCVILGDGRMVRAIVVNEVEPDLDRLAIESVQTWKFKAGSYKGKAADIIMDVPVDFR